MTRWNRCVGVQYHGSPFHVLCYRRADKTGLCIHHRRTIAKGLAQPGVELLNELPCGCHDDPTYGHVIMAGCKLHD